MWYIPISSLVVLYPTARSFQSRRGIEMKIKKEWLMKKICNLYRCSDGEDNQYPACDGYKKGRCSGAHSYTELLGWFSEIDVNVRED